MTIFTSAALHSAPFQPTEEGHETVRAAAWVVIQLGQVYTWPIDHLDSDLQLAIKSLEEVWQQWLGPLVEFHESIKAIIDSEIATLRDRLPKDS